MEINLCVNCENKISKDAKYCRYCATAEQRKKIKEENEAIRAENKLKGYHYESTNT